MSADDRKWRDLTNTERLGLLKAVIEGKEDEEKVDRVMGRVASYFLGGTQWDFIDATNILMRELWRDEHDGDVSEWDANVKASGMKPPTDPRSDLLERKGEMTPEEFAAAEAKLYAPQPIVVGNVSWSGILTVGENPLLADAYEVRVVWPTGKRTPDVFVDGAKARPKHRRRWLRLLADAGVTRERVIEAEASGRESVLEV